MPTSIDHTIDYTQVEEKQEHRDDRTQYILYIARSSFCKLLNWFPKHNFHLVCQNTVNYDLKIKCKCYRRLKYKKINSKVWCKVDDSWQDEVLELKFAVRFLWLIRTSNFRVLKLWKKDNIGKKLPILSEEIFCRNKLRGKVLRIFIKLDSLPSQYYFVNLFLRSNQPPEKQFSQNCSYRA